MKIDPFLHLQSRAAPGILSGVPGRGRSLSSTRPGRFVTQSHALGVSPANPRAIVAAAVIAIVIYLIGRRLSE